MSAHRVILDTNVFVAAGFNPQSASAGIVDDVRSGRLRMVWNEATRRETRHILQQIPPLSWDRFADLFRDEDRYEGETRPGEFSFVADPDDRKFAALSAATGATLVTSDDHLLEHRERIGTEVVTPREYRQRELT